MRSPAFEVLPSTSGCRRVALLGAAAAGVVLGTIAASGQTAKAPTPFGAIGATTPGKPAPAAAGAAATSAPVSADPASTSATYGDWVLRCQRLGEADKVQRVCEVSQTVQVQNQRDPVAEMAIGHLGSDPTLRLTVVLPPSVSFPSTVEVASTVAGGPAVQLQWRRCVPGGCFADGVPPDDAMKAWRAASAAGKLTFKDAAGRDVTLPISFRGLAQALDALTKA